jgi:1-acyl-sn-glycerol-3-phosphate acyltransferase
MRERLKRIGWHTFAPPFYWGCTYLLRFLLTVLVRWKVTGREHVPKHGAFMVVSNHLSNPDPPILGAAIASRRIRFMAKIELFKMPMGAIPRLWDAFPVRRFESDLGAMLTAERILKKGGALGMFPEGTRSRTGYMNTFHAGTAVIALRAGATILPCAMTGTESLRNPFGAILRRKRFTVRIGEPIHVEAVRRPTEEQVSALMERIRAAIAAQLPASYLPPYTGTEGGVNQADGAGTTSE